MRTSVVFPLFCNPTSVNSISCLKKSERSHSSIWSTSDWNILLLSHTRAPVFWPPRESERGEERRGEERRGAAAGGGSRAAGGPFIK